MSTPKHIAIIMGSIRPNRVGAYIAPYIKDLVQQRLSSTGKTDCTLDLIDLSIFDLPLSSEPAIPQALPRENPTPHYEQEKTRAWSAAVAKYDAFIFVTPQYNWSIPAGLKNAIDYLFWEWVGKPVAVVSYGGHGGNKVGPALLMCVQAMKMKPVQKRVELTIKVSGPGRGNDSTIDGCQKEGELPETVKAAWKEAGAEADVSEMVDELVSLF